MTVSEEPTPAVLFRPISGTRAFEEVIGQITYAIRAGYYMSGDKLPTVAELAELFRVSRPTVGDAVHVLARAGVVEVRRGATGGIVVRSGNVPAALVGFDVELRAREMIELVEARRPVEMELARLAAMRATEKDFEQMAEAAAMLHAAQEPDDIMHAENLFHYLIGRAARSDMLARYQHEILEAKAVLMNSWTVRLDPVPMAVLHDETLAALRTRDPEVVRAAMDDHLRDLEDTVERMRRGRDRDARRSAKAST